MLVSNEARRSQDQNKQKKVGLQTAELCYSLPEDAAVALDIDRSKKRSWKRQLLSDTKHTEALHSEEVQASNGWKLRVLWKSNSCLLPIASHIGQCQRQAVRLNSLLSLYQYICAYVRVYTHTQYMHIYT